MPGPSGKRGGQRKFSDHAIETALMLRLVFKLPLRQAEAFLRSILSLMDIDLEAPDHTTLSRRGQHLNIRLDRVASTKRIHLMVDSTGLSIVGEGEWAAVKWDEEIRAPCSRARLFSFASSPQSSPQSPRWWRSIRLIDVFHWLSGAHPMYPRSMAKSKDKKPKAKTNKAKLTAKEKKKKKLKKKER